MKTFYEVIAKCGHVGRNKYIPIKFTVEAESGKDAAAMVRRFPRVKHDHKDAILSVAKIDSTRYLEINAINDNNPYLKCKSKYEQRLIVGLDQQLEEDFHGVKERHDKQKRYDKVAYKLKKAKIIAKSYVKEYNLNYDYIY